MFYEVIPEGKVEALTYSFNGSLLAGQIVVVPIGRRVVPGIVVKKVAQPVFKTRAILKVLYSKPLPRHLLDTVHFIHDYYMASSGQAVSLILPRGVQKKRRKTEQMFGNDLLGGSCHPPLLNIPEHSEILPQIQLNQAQKNTLQGLQQAPGATKLLFGVTGSGKTNIYLKMAQNALRGHM